MSQSDVTPSSTPSQTVYNLMTPPPAVGRHLCMTPYDEFSGQSNIIKVTYDQIFKKINTMENLNSNYPVFTITGIPNVRFSENS